MNMSFKTALKFGTSAMLLTMIFNGSAWAVEPNDFANRLTEQLKNNSIILVNNGVKADGDNIIIHDARISFNVATKDTKSSAQEFSLGDLNFKNVTEDKEGNFTAETLNIDAIYYDNQKETMAFKNIALSQIHLVSPQNTNLLLKAAPLENAAIEQISFLNNNQTYFKMVNIQLIYTAQSSNDVITTKLTIPNISYDPLKEGNPSAVKTLADLGYNTLDGSVILNGDWNIKTGNLKINDYEINVNNVGKLSLSMAVQGFTPEFNDNFKAFMSNMQTQKDQNMVTMAALGLAQQISFENYSMRYDDASLTNRILDDNAKQSNMTRDQIVAQIKGILPFVGMQIKNPAFVTQLTDQVGKFLDNPKNLTISAAPDKPTPFSILMATGMSAPETLIDTLHVKVEANK